MTGLRAGRVADQILASRAKQCQRDGHAKLIRVHK